VKIFISGEFEFGFRLSGEVLIFAPPKKSTQKKGGPGGLPADAGFLRFSPVWALAEYRSQTG
jgi:hypothetical protein